MSRMSGFASSTRLEYTHRAQGFICFPVQPAALWCVKWAQILAG